MSYQTPQGCCIFRKGKHTDCKIAKTPIIAHFYRCFNNDFITYPFQSWIFYKIRLYCNFYTQNKKCLLFTTISLKIVSTLKWFTDIITSVKEWVLNLQTKGWYMVTFASTATKKCVKQLKYHRFDVRLSCANTTKTKHFSSY